jgi:hypothetical protein
MEIISKSDSPKWTKGRTMRMMYEPFNFEILALQAFFGEHWNYTEGKKYPRRHAINLAYAVIHPSIEKHLLPKMLKPTWKDQDGVIYVLNWLKNHEADMGLPFKASNGRLSPEELAKQRNSQLADKIMDKI